MLRRPSNNLLNPLLNICNQEFHCSRSDCLCSRMFMLGDPFPGHVHNMAQECVYFIMSPNRQLTFSLNKVYCPILIKYTHFIHTNIYR